MSSVVLSVRNISASYGRENIIKNVSFDICAGEFCALLGLNGSGKTTLLRAICGLLKPAGGSSYYLDTDINKLGEKRRALYISFIPQRHSRLEGITVLDAVLMGQNARLGVFQPPAEKDRKAAFEALKTMQIPHLAGEDYSRLSEGQKQLVILSRVLLQDTPVVLMDEPDSTLDYNNKHMMLSKTREMVHMNGKACIVTLHDPVPALSYCDRLILLDNGQIASVLDMREASHGEISSSLTDVYGKQAAENILRVL